MADIRRLVTLKDIKNEVANTGGEADASGWTAAAGAGSAGAPVQVTANRTGSTGTKSIQTTGVTVTANAGIQLLANVAATPVSPGQRVFGYGWGRCTTASTFLDLRISFYNSAAVLISHASVQVVVPTTNTWYELQGSAVAPANSAFCSLNLLQTNTSTSPVLQADDFMLVVDDTFAGPYIDTTSTVSTVVKDLEVDNKLMAGRDSFTIKAPDRNVSSAGSGRRYAGTYAISDTHTNAQANWKLLVTDTTADLASQSVEAVLQPLERLNSPDLHLEWRPDGNTYSTFYEIRGPATWQLGYSRLQYTSNRRLELDVQIPISPLGRGGVTTQTFASSGTPLATPAVIGLTSAIPGSAPAQVEMTLNRTDNTSNPAFAVLGWWSRLPSPPTGYNNCYSFIQAEATKPGTTPTGWASTGDAGASGGNYLAVAASGAGTASAKYGISTLGVTSATIDIEIWARVASNPGTVSPKITASMQSGVGASIYTREWGLAGRPITVPTVNNYRLTRVGTITIPTQSVASNWTLTIGMSWAAGSTGTIGLDCLMLVPADQRAVSPSGEALDAYYPRFLQNTSNSARVISKTIKTDLSGSVKLDGNIAPDPGLGGSLLEFPAGNVDMAVLLSEMPADSGADALFMSSNFNCWLDFKITPRYFVVKGS